MKVQGNASKVVYEVLYEGHDGWLLFNANQERPFFTRDKNYYKEYKEPRTITRYVNVWEDNTTKEVFMGSAFKSREESLGVNKGNHNRLDVIEVKWTESE